MVDLGQFKAYLLLLARTRLGRGGGPDASDLVQQSLLKAHRNLEQLKGRSRGQQAAWLRQILAHNLADAQRGRACSKRDVTLERSLEDELARSSVRLADCLAADQSSPSQRLCREERAVRLAQEVEALIGTASCWERVVPSRAPGRGRRGRYVM